MKEGFGLFAAVSGFRAFNDEVEMNKIWPLRASSERPASITALELYLDRKLELTR